MSQVPFPKTPAARVAVPSAYIGLGLKATDILAGAADTVFRTVANKLGFSGQSVDAAVQSTEDLFKIIARAKTHKRAVGIPFWLAA